MVNKIGKKNRGKSHTRRIEPTTYKDNSFSLNHCACDTNDLNLGNVVLYIKIEHEKYRARFAIKRALLLSKNGIFNPKFGRWEKNTVDYSRH